MKIMITYTLNGCCDTQVFFVMRSWVFSC